MILPFINHIMSMLNHRCKRERIQRTMGKCTERNKYDVLFIQLLFQFVSHVNVPASVIVHACSILKYWLLDVATGPLQ